MISVDQPTPIPPEAVTGTLYIYGVGPVGYVITPNGDHWEGTGQYGAQIEEGWWYPSSYAPTDIVGPNPETILQKIREHYLEEE